MWESQGRVTGETSTPVFKFIEANYDLIGNFV